MSEGHQISETARAELIRKFHDIEDVTVHIDPEDDEEVAQGRDLGLRGEVEARLRAAWADVPEAEAIRRITLHYLDGRIQVEVELPLANSHSDPTLRSRFGNASSTRQGRTPTSARYVFCSADAPIWIIRPK